MIIQTDADNTIYKGNLLVSLGWRYLFFLFREKKYLQFLDRFFKLPLFYFISLIPQYVHTAFLPFKGCPVGLIKEIKNPLKDKWIKVIKEINPERIIIISHQEETVLKAFIESNHRLKNYNFEIISNRAIIEKGKFTGEAEVIINPRTKYQYVNKELIYIGDLKDYFYYGEKKDNFILV